MSRAVSSRSHDRFGVGGPHGSVAVSGFSLDCTRSKSALERVVRDVDLAGIISKGKELVTRAADLGLRLSGGIASGRRGKNRRELFFQFSRFPRQGRGGEIGDDLGQIKRSAQPKLELEGQIV